MCMTCACTSGRSNESVKNVHNYYGQQPYSPNLALPVAQVVPPKLSLAPPPPAPPPPSPSLKPPSSLETSPDPSGQYSRYTINDDLLRDMAQQLRKPDKNNIRKIPRRADMKIPSMNQNNTNLAIPLPPPAPQLPLIAYDLSLSLEVPVKPTLPLV